MRSGVGPVGLARVRLLQFVEFFLLIRRKFLADVFADAAQFIAHLGRDLLPKRTRAVEAVVHHFVDALTLIRTQVELAIHLIEKFFPLQLPGRCTGSGYGSISSCVRPTIILLNSPRVCGPDFNDETASHNTATKYDHGREDDLPRAHQAASSTC